MASLSKEKRNLYRLHWKFKIRVGPRAGETIEGSLQLGRCTKAAAKARLREIDAWEEKVRMGRLVPGRSFSEVRDVWLHDRELTCTPQTLERTARVLSLYERWRELRGFPCNTVAEVSDRDDLTAWRDHRLDTEAGRKTVANDLSTLSAFFTWCVREKYLDDNPVERVARPRFVTKKEGTPLTRRQAGRWLRSIRARSTRSGRGPRNWDDVRRKRCLIVFLLNTGVRNGELCGLNVEDLRIDDHECLVYVIGKGLKERWVPLNNAATSAARLHLRSRGCPKRGPLFVTQAGIRYNVRQLSGEIVGTAQCFDEPVEANPHNLRHTFATWLVRSVSDVSTVQKILGHENVNTTLKYYVHTGDHELAQATSNLRCRKDDTGVARPRQEEDFRIIPFPKRKAE